MQINEETIRHISRETISVLGQRANPVLVKKIVKEVLRRLKTKAEVLETQK